MPIRRKRRRELPFESGCVGLPHGKQFIPNRHAVASWVIEQKQPFDCLGNTYEILYQLTGDTFVLVEYNSDEFADRTLRAREVHDDVALSWLTEHNFPFPDCLADRVEWVTELPLRRLLADSRVVEAIRKDWPTFNPGRGADVEALRTTLTRWFRIPIDQVEELTPNDVFRKIEELDREAEAESAAAIVHVDKVVVGSLEVGNATFRSHPANDDIDDADQERPQIIPFPTPKDATWSDVHIRFVDGHTVFVQVNEKSKRYSFSELGMADGRSGRPNLQWELLKAFAEGKGKVTWDNRDATPKNQKRRETLARDLQSFFQIQVDPFVSRSGGWHSLFHIEPES